jgi:hypothetical protein
MMVRLFMPNILRGLAETGSRFIFPDSAPDEFGDLGDYGVSETV